MGIGGTGRSDRRTRRRLWLPTAGAVGLCLALVAGVSGAESGAERVRADLERYIAARVGDGDPVVEVPPLAAFAIDRERHPGALSTELSTRTEPPFRGRVPITVELRAAGEVVARNVVSPYVRVDEPVVVVSRDLVRGDVIGAGDLAREERDEARLASDVIRSEAVAVGQRMRRSVRAGQPLRRSQIETVPIVDRGDRVTMVLRHGALVIRGVGRARERGGVGDWIRVQNLDSRREVTGRVDREGNVHVAF